MVERILPSPGVKAEASWARRAEPQGPGKLARSLALPRMWRYGAHGSPVAASVDCSRFSGKKKKNAVWQRGFLLRRTIVYRTFRPTALARVPERRIRCTAPAKLFPLARRAIMRTEASRFRLLQQSFRFFTKNGRLRNLLRGKLCRLSAHFVRRLVVLPYSCLDNSIFGQVDVGHVTPACRFTEHCEVRNCT